MGFGGGGAGSVDDSMNQLVTQTWTTWLTDTINQNLQVAAANQQSTALQEQRGQQDYAVGQSNEIIAQQQARDNQARAREEALIRRMNDMQASFEQRMAAQADYERNQIAAQEAERARLAEEAKQASILADQKKQEELRKMRSQLWAGGYEGTKVTGGQGDTSTAQSTSGMLLGSPGSLSSENDPTGWDGEGNPVTTVRGNKDQGILGLLSPNGVGVANWLENMVGVPKGQRPASSWINEQYQGRMLGVGSG